jgi:hypothetical protein
MELQLKADVVKEIREGTGKLLLHDEIETKPGMYEVVPVWETVEEENVMTPLELYQQVQDEGYHVDYLRIAIVCPPATTIALQADLRRTSRRLSRLRCRSSSGVS